MSFEVGDRVVCVDDTPYVLDGERFPVGISIGQQFTVRAVFVPKSLGPWRENGPRISIGINNLAGLALAGRGWPSPREGWDMWSPDRFRKIERRDISESLKALKELAINCPPLVEADQ